MASEHAAPTSTEKIIALSPEQLSAKLKEGDVALIDVREQDEFAFEKIAGALLRPLSKLAPSQVQDYKDKDCVLYCQSSGRSGKAAKLLCEAGWSNVQHLQGGLNAWKSAGLPIEKGRNVLPLMRQVQIAAGSLVLTGVVLGTLLHPGFYGISAFVGAGLVFAGISGWCGMALLLEKMPWNRE